MSISNQDLKKRIAELEKEVQIQAEELGRYRYELNRVNTILEKMIAETSQELAMAQSLQKLMSPMAHPTINGFEFSTKFIPGSRYGGDYFDIFEHEDKLRFGIFLSSASGYGLSSILLSLFIQLSSQMEARRNLSPHEVLVKIIQEVTPQIKNQDSASLFYGVMDCRTFEMEYSSIGNLTVFFQEYGKKHLKKLSSSRAELKKEDMSLPESFKIQLNPKDRLVFATEGLVNAVSQSGETWGETRYLESILLAPKSGAHSLRNEILYQQEKFSLREEPLRDQTILVAEVKGRVIKLA